MNYKYLLHTVSYLRSKQIYFQVLYRLHKAKYENIKLDRSCKPILFIDPIFKPVCYSNNIFSFLNIPSKFVSWNDDSNGMLWAFNINYMDWLSQDGMDFKTGAEWINKYIDEFSTNKIGPDSYTTALRGINWIKFISKYREQLDKVTLEKWNDSLFSQYVLLSKKLEFHFLGNHLLEDVYSLFIASIYFQDAKFYSKATKVLRYELNEQVLPDGAHNELSPMYHCILLDRLLDCYNFSVNNEVFDNQKEMTAFLEHKAVLMLGHLENIVYNDGVIPLLNDSAYGIAPTKEQLFSYASRLNLKWKPVPMKECGYRKFKNDRFEAVMDACNVVTCQPAHTQADTFNYELRIDGKPFIVDTGLSTYNKTARRQYERSTAAHNTVAVNGMNSSEVWSGFRVGNRAEVSISEESDNRLIASHNGFGNKYIHTRKFICDENKFEITDNVKTPADCISYIHLDEGVNIISSDKNCIKTSVANIEIEGADSIEISDEKISKEYNIFLSSKTIKIHFTSDLKYTISL